MAATEATTTMSSDLAEPLLETPAPTEHQDHEAALTNNAEEDDEPGATGEGDDYRDIVFCGGKRRMNHNVFLSLLLAVLYGISDNLWGGTVFCAYLKKLGDGQNEWVGNLEAVNGLASLFSALPVGYLADKLGRSRVIRAGGVLIAVTSILHISVLDWIGVGEGDNEHHRRHSETSMILLVIVMALWGVAGGIVNGPCQAIYADSTPAGSRTRYYQYLFACYMISSCLGPLLSIVLFQTMGDNWKLHDLRVIVIVGLCMEFLNSLIMLGFDDSKALDEGDDDGGAQGGNDPPDTGSPQLADNEESSPDMTERLLPESAPSRELGDAAAAPQVDDVAAQQLMKRRQRWIPFIMSMSGFVMAIGSGMTVKFFPLFFKDEVGMSPTQVQLVYVAVPLAMVMFSWVATRMSTSFGRVQTNLVFTVMGLSCLYSMVFFKSYLDTRPFLLVPIYITRTAAMNGTYPLCESILMDFVPKNERARWKSLEAITSFGWCGSAALGGWVSDRYDYTRTFLITAILQTVGMLVFALLLPLVPRREDEQQQRATSGEEEEAQ